jgi:hypothetical protein
MSIRRTLLGSSAAVALAVAAPVAAQQPVHVAPNAPRDKPVSATMSCQWRAARAAMTPHVARALATFPDAKRRYEAGLPAKTSFFVTTRLHDDQGREEQVFVAVDSVSAGRVMGRIWSRIGVVHALPDSEIVDWMFSRPDGSEEGNFVGKFLDTYTPPAVCSDSTP